MANGVRRQLQASTPHIFCWVYFTGTPVNISELSGECWGGAVGDGLCREMSFLESNRASWR